MNNHQDYWTYPEQQSPYVSTGSRILTAFALLVLGYYTLSFLDLWPATLKRQICETIVRPFPSRLILIMQCGMNRLGLLSRDARRFRLEDLSNLQAKSEALRQMLGFDNTRITNVVRKARTLSGIDSILPASTEIGPPGLGNWDNSCYQNSTLHGFASLPAFNQYISCSLDKMRQNDMTAPTHEALFSFLGKLNAADEWKRTLWTPAVLKSMDSWQQQDAQEYFSRILDAVEKEDVRIFKSFKRKSGLETLPEGKLRNSVQLMDLEVKSDDNTEDKVLADGVPKLRLDASNLHEKPNLLETSEESSDRTAGLPSRNPLDGMLAQSLKCQKCGFTEGLSLTQFNCLTVNLGNGSHCTIEDLLDEYTAPEDVDGVECTQCTKLADSESDQPTATDVNTSPTSLPKPSKLKPVLSTKSKQITIGRLPTDLVLHINRSIYDNYGDQRKNTALVDFPARLYIYSQWCAPLDADHKTKVEATYELRCAVLHYGRHEDGHYIAYAKRDKGWYCFNDEIVTRVGEEEVLGRGNAFMLFYEVMETQGVHEQEALYEVMAEASQQATEIGEGSQKALSVHGDEEAIANELIIDVPDARPSTDQPVLPMSQTTLPELEQPVSSSEVSEMDSTAEEVNLPHEDTPIPAMRTASDSPSSPSHPRMEYGSVASVF